MIQQKSTAEGFTRGGRCFFEQPLILLKFCKMRKTSDKGGAVCRENIEFPGNLNPSLLDFCRFCKSPEATFARKGGVSDIMVLVKVREGETIEEALRRFKRECERNGIMQEIKKREFYESPSVRRKKKQAEARRKMRRRQMRHNRY